MGASAVVGCFYSSWVLLWQLGASIVVGQAKPSLKTGSPKSSLRAGPREPPSRREAAACIQFALAFLTGVSSTTSAAWSKQWVQPPPGPRFWAVVPPQPNLVPDYAATTPQLRRRRPNMLEHFPLGPVAEVRGPRAMQHGPRTVRAEGPWTGVAMDHMSSTCRCDRHWHDTIPASPASRPDQRHARGFHCEDPICGSSACGAHPQSD